MPASRSSRTSPTSSLAPAAVLAAALLLSAAALWWHFTQGWTLYYGDAEAHLNIARRILDSRTPGLEQIGTVWLPLPHALAALTVGSPGMWRTGLAASLVSALAHALSVWLMFLLLRRLTANLAASLTGAALLALNPNLLYLQSTPMTETLSIATILATLYFCLRAIEGRAAWAAAAGLAALAATLTRYEAWFLLPAFALYLLLHRRWKAAFLFTLLASLGPLAWFAHNWWWWGDPLEFYRGPWSAQAIYRRALAQNMQRYPGDGDWLKALEYYWAAVRATAGWPLAWAGLAASVFCLTRRLALPALILFLPGVFYVLSMHGSGTPIFLPDRWPFSHYNTRYGLALLPALALTLAAAAPFHRALGPLFLAGALSPWLIQPSPEAWICWRESEINSRARRQWSSQAAAFLAAHYRGGGIAASFGDLAGIFRRAGIPFREMLHEGQGAYWLGALARPEFLLHEEWAITLSGDALSNALARAARHGLRYDCARRIEVKGAPVLEIWRLSSRVAPPLIEPPSDEEPLDFEEALRRVP
jgi:hypothetical protein